MSARKFWSEWHNDWVQRSSVRGVDFAKRLVMRLGKHCEDVEPEIYIRGWLIERARTKKARRAAEFWRDAYVGLDMAKSHEPGGYDSRLPWEAGG